jgi:hypothetical protein
MIVHFFFTVCILSCSITYCFCGSRPGFAKHYYYYLFYYGFGDHSDLSTNGALANTLGSLSYCVELFTLLSRLLATTVYGSWVGYFIGRLLTASPACLQASGVAVLLLYSRTSRTNVQYTCFLYFHFSRCRCLGVNMIDKISRLVLYFDTQSWGIMYVCISLNLKHKENSK